MKSVKLPTIAVLAAALLVASTTFADSSPAGTDIFCMRLLQSNPTFTQKEFATYFDANFITQVPFAELQSIFSDLTKDVGNCVSSSTVAQKRSGLYVLTLTTIRGFNIQLNLTINPTNHLFTGLLVGGVDNPALVIKSWDDLGIALKSLDAKGLTGATLMTADNQLHLTYSADTIFAIGSTFKLYILGALYETITKGLHTWDEPLAIRDAWKSLPSGTMQNLSAGTTASLRDFATNMISISDNTAADHLLYTLGRGEVEAMLKPMHNEHADLNIPFLSTLEMFKLKWAIDPKKTATYIQSDSATRRKDLDALALVPRSAVLTNGVSMAFPTDIANIEWFGSTEDTCQAILWLGKQNNQELKKILSKSVPLADFSPTGHWSYVGYKGGSEPGVISMTYLLESKKGQQACFSASWNNTTKNVSEYLFMDVVKKALSFAESQVP